MASSRRTYDTDSITLRTVFAKNPGNSNVPALRVLTADGAGGTYWAIPSTLGIIPSFNEIITSAGTYTADLSYNRFRLIAGEGIGMVNGPTGSNQTSLFAKAFSQFDISGENTLYAFANNQLDPSVTFAGENGIQIRADPATNTFFIGASGNGQTFISTGIYGFSQLKVTPTTSTITSSLIGWDGDFISATSPSTLLRFAGFNDIQLSTNVTTNTVFFTISTFTSEGYLAMSNAAFSASPSTLSTISSLYVQKSIYDSTIYTLSTNAVQWSSVQSSINALAFSTGAEFLKLTGLINARATIVQLNNNIAQVNSNIVSTTQGLGSAGYISTAGGGSGDVTKANLISTVEGLGTYGYISTGGGGSGDVTKANLVSTVEGLGTLGYISSLSSLTISTLFNTGSISTFSLEVYGSNTLTNSGSTILRGAIYLAGPTYVAGSFAGTTIVSSSNLTSSIIGLGSVGYISTAGGGSGDVTTANLVSSIQGLGSAGYVSSGSLSNLVSTPNLLNLVSTSYINSTITGLGTLGYLSTFHALTISSGNITVSTVNLIDPFNNLENYLTVSSATLLLNGQFITGASGGGGGGGVTQIIAGSGINISPPTGVGNVTITNAGPTSDNIVSTVRGLGSAGYVSTASLSNLVSSPNLLNLVSSPNLLNLVSSPNLLNLVSSPNLLNLVSSPNLLNLVSSPNLLNLVSSPNLLNLVSSPNLLNLVSTSFFDLQLTSTLKGLGTLGYVSSGGGDVTTQNLTSSIEGLGTSLYVSTLSLYSTTARWADYQATSVVILASTNAVIRNPTPFDPATSLSYPMKLETEILDVYDSNNAPAFVNLAGITFLTSTTNESYTIGFDSVYTGSVSSLAIAYYQTSLQTASLYVSSLYLGNIGGTVQGQLTTDDTATNLFWKGTQLNGGGGGGITQTNLTSTVVGLGTVGYISTGGGGGGITAEQLTSTATRWATYPAVSTIIFSNSTQLTANEIVSPGATFFQLVTDLSVLVTTSTTVDGITPFRGINASQYTIADQVNLGTLQDFNYTYNLIAGSVYTGSISTPTITNYDGTLGSLYLSSLFIAAPEGTASGTAGALTTDVTASKLYYSTNQLANAKVNVVVSTLGADNSQLFTEDLGKYFLLTQNNNGTQINMPPLENGWNVTIKNMPNSTEPFTVDTGTQAILAAGVATTIVCDGTTFYAI